MKPRKTIIHTGAETTLLDRINNDIGAPDTNVTTRIVMVPKPTKF